MTCPRLPTANTPMPTPQTLMPTCPRRPRHPAHVCTRDTFLYIYTLAHVYLCRGHRGLSGHKGLEVFLAWTIIISGVGSS